VPVKDDPERFSPPRPSVDSWASSAGVRRSMQSNRSRDTGPEIRLRSELHRRGLRFRKDVPIRLGDVRTRVDILFPGAALAVFVDGCFWHRCPEHGSEPKTNGAYWLTKLENNVRRDRRTELALAAFGWAVVRVWEHEPPSRAADHVQRALAEARSGRPRHDRPARADGIRTARLGQGVEPVARVAGTRAKARVSAAAGTRKG
jgi:DNA mismatch endonuclease, patch repair protein